MSVGDLLPRNSYGDADLTTGLVSLSERQRPNLARRDSDHILSYYHSEYAGRDFYDVKAVEDYLSMEPSHHDQSSRPNTPSEYSSESEDDSSPMAEHHIPAPRIQQQTSLSSSASSHTRRPSVPSEGGADRRRLAIVEMDSSAPLSISHRQQEWDKEGPGDVSSSLLSRRGLHVSGLALMAPADASPKSYTDLTPPPTAPIVPEGRFEEHILVPGHQRSASEATPHTAYRSRLHHKSSRDIGIVGTGGIYSIVEGIGTSMQNEYDGLKVPIFQTPAKSRSPSPSAQTPDLSSSATTSFNESYYTTPGMPSSSLCTPELGETKDIGQPAVGPVLVGLNSQGVMRRQPSNPAIHISSSPSSPRHQASPYIYYEPGVHSTAGPLPPPPRSLFDNDIPASNAPPPRPPRTLRTPLPLSSSIPQPKRDVEALKQSLRLPESVNAVLASRGPSRELHARQDSLGSDASHYSDDENENQPDDRPSRARRNKSIHRREGAFPPSSSSTVAQHADQPSGLPLAESDQNRQNIAAIDSSVPPSDTIRLCTQPTSSNLTDDREDDESKPQLRREPSWVSINHEHARVASPSILSDDESIRRSTSRSPSIVSSLPVPPPKPESESASDNGEHMLSKAGNSLKATFSNLKRFSTLPRTPSSTNLSTVSSVPTRSLQPSPSMQPISIRRSPQPKVRNRNPAALQYQEILGKKQASERLRLYVDKINDLSRHDTGLGEWVVHMKIRGSGSRATLSYGLSEGKGPSLPSVIAASTQPRHTSHGSIVSEATFPVRPDAYTATDLATRPSDEIPTSPPPLPYPSLVGMVAPARNPNRASTILMPSSVLSPRSQPATLAPPSKPTGGFFSSLGRKTSVKKDRSPAMSPNSSPPKLTKRPPNTNSNGSPPRLIRVISPPLIPGGPRAAPTKMQRAQTLSVAPRALSPEPIDPVSRRNTHRASAMSRRPSLFTKSSSAPSSSQSTALDFNRQVDKLADLIPHAERRVLAAYLQNTGQDMLAIGQYLEDERKGIFRYR